jgi:hypothetical protein
VSAGVRRVLRYDSLADIDAIFPIYAANRNLRTSRGLGLGGSLRRIVRLR